MRLIASSLLAGLIAVGSISPAFADQHGRGHGKNNNHGGGRGGDHHDNRGGGDWGRRDDNRRGGDWGRRDDHYRGGYDRGGSHYNWGRGSYFSYRPHYSNFVVVNDYYRYRLPPPRYGEYYYRDNNTGEILLVAAATGLVLWALTH